MAREKKPEEAGPSKLYLVSFGDTMTTLLAFFIVLCSMADDQSGANLYRGTGSFVNAMDGVGSAGMIAKKLSSKAIALSDSNPLYPVPSDDEKTESGRKGPEEDNGLRSIDREKEELQRFLNEMNRLSQIKKHPSTEGEVVFDLFDRLNKTSPHFTPTYNSVLAQVIPLLRQTPYRAELIVWSKNPGPFALRQAFDLSAGLHDELSQLSQLDDAQQQRLTSFARPWAYSDARRPVISIVMRKVNDSSQNRANK